MRNVLTLTGLAHAIAFHGFRQNDGRLALIAVCGGIGGIDFVRVVATAIEARDVLIGDAGDQIAGFWILIKEVLTRVRAAKGFEVLVFAVQRFFHQFAQHAFAVAR